MRSAVIIIEDDRIALIERVRAGKTYYVFPGGKLEPGESAEEAAIREAYEELGVDVELQQLAAQGNFRDRQQFYYFATISGGQFGTGTGAELSSDPRSPRGSYRAVWLDRKYLLQYDLRPRALALALQNAEYIEDLQLPLQIQEP